MSKLEDFEDIPYEDEPRYTEAEVQEMIKNAEERITKKYLLDKMNILEKEKNFYKNTIMTILQNKE